jgi:hypothetical protein
MEPQAEPGSRSFDASYWPLLPSLCSTALPRRRAQVRLAFSAAAIAAGLVSSWPVSTMPATDTDHFQTPRSMAWTTVYSAPWHCIPLKIGVAFFVPAIGYSKAHIAK